MYACIYSSIFYVKHLPIINFQHIEYDYLVDLYNFIFAATL